MSNSNNNVAVIGAGASGLLATKALIEEGIFPIVYEKQGYSGGIWGVEADLSKSPANFDLQTNVSKASMAISDFPFAESYGLFPTWNEVANYLYKYSNHFQLHNYISFKHEILKIKKIEAGFIIIGTNSEGKPFEKFFKQVIISTGLYGQKFIPKVKNLSKFTGEISHAIEFEHGIDFLGKKVLVVGYASSAIDISATLARNNVACNISHKSPSVIFPQFIGGKPYDYTNSRLFNMLPNSIGKKLFMNKLARSCKETASPLHLSAYGCPKSDNDFTKYKVTASKDFRKFIANGKIKAFPEIIDFNDNTVTFKDKSSIEVDHIIFATGYSPSFPEIENIPIEWDGNIPLAYKHIFPPSEPNLAFVGVAFVRGGTFPFYEMQSRFIAQVFAQKHLLPGRKAMEKSIQKELEIKRKIGQDYFVEYPIPYMDDLAKAIHIYPGYFHSPKVLRSILSGPFKSAQFRLKGMGKSETAKSYLKDFHKEK